MSQVKERRRGNNSLGSLDEKLREVGFIPIAISTYEESPIKFLLKDYQETGEIKRLNIIYSRIDFGGIDSLPIGFYVLYVRKG